MRPVSRPRLRRSEAPKSAIRVALGDAIRAVRREQGHSQEGLAARVGLDRSYYSAIERGEYKASIDTFGKIACGLDVTLSELLGRAGL